MTDKEKLKSVLLELGIKITEDTHSLVDEQEVPVENVVINADDNTGWAGFECVFVFDLNGKFKSVGVWE